jgi:hypothetical protein
MAAKETDIDAMHHIVDDHHTVLEEELEALMKAVKKRLLQKHRQFYEPIIEQLERKLAERISQNEIEAKRGADLVGFLGRTDVILSRLINHIIIYRNRDKTAGARAQMFSAWASMVTDRAVITRVATERFLHDPAKRMLFHRWVRRWRKVSLQRQRRELRRSNERDIKAQESEGLQKIAALQAELDAVKQLLIDHEKEHAEMQEKLRRAFMRGVVNLNLEAMDVFGEVPTTETLPPAKPERTRGRRRDRRESPDDFVVEPAPRISVIRHH